MSGNKAMQYSFITDMDVPIHPLMLEMLTTAVKKQSKCKILESARAGFRHAFGDCDVFFVLTREAAIVLSMQSLLKPFHAVICDASSYLNFLGCGAFERFAGSKLLTIKTGSGKINVEQLSFTVRNAQYNGIVCKVISLSQPTEFGSFYSLVELAHITAFAAEHQLLVHMDGSRLANAAAALNCSLQEIIRGVDVITFSGLPHGMLFSEAIIFFNRQYAQDFPYVRCQGMQELVHNECIAMQFTALFTNNLWLENASHANAMARLLAERLSKIEELDLAYPISTNKVYARINAEYTNLLSEQHSYKIQGDEICWTTSYATKSDDIVAMVESIKHTLKQLK